MLLKRMKVLHESYTTVRNEGVPFPLESVVAWYAVFALQEHLNVSSDILEMGVEHGGTAFLEMMALREDETLDLIDLKKSPRFAEMFETLSPDLAARVRFHERSTRSPQLDVVAGRRYRFVHIDAGHSKQDVLDDIGRFAGCVSEDGILVLDDVFEIRWPGVAEAIFEAVPKTDLVPFLFVNRKLYLAKGAAGARYRATLIEALPELSELGPIRHWVEPMLGGDTLIWKQTFPSQRFADLFASAPL